MNHYVKKLIIVFWLGAVVCAADIPVFERQIIQAESDHFFNWWWHYHWIDLDGDSLKDLLVVPPSRKALIYKQSDLGVPKIATQSIQFPENTAWYAVHDITEDPGKELIISTGDGIAVYHQSNGVFEDQPQILIKAKQVFADTKIRNIWDAGSPWWGKDKVDIPVIFTDHAIIYESDKSLQYKPGRKIEFQYSASVWKDDSSCVAGGKEVETLRIQTRATDKSKTSKKKGFQSENEYIEKVFEKIKEGRYWHDYGVEEKDINADNKVDLVLWYQVGDIDAKTIITVFIRQENGKLPEKPNQVLRCQGFAIDVDYRMGHASLLNDIDNDGFSEIVLGSLKTKPLSASSIVEAVVSKGLECTLSIRSFKKPGGYSNKADFKLDITTVLPLGQWVVDFITLDSDFNGDGSKDLRVRRGPTRCDIYLSLPNGGFFDREPKLQLEVPTEGRMFVEDLNNDGISDIYVIDFEKGQITVFLSKPMKEKGAF